MNAEQLLQDEIEDTKRWIDREKDESTQPMLDWWVNFVSWCCAKPTSHIFK